jgi:hypothetical protein
LAIVIGVIIGIIRLDIIRCARASGVAQGSTAAATSAQPIRVAYFMFHLLPDPV